MKRVRVYACREWSVGHEDWWFVGLYRDKPFGEDRVADLNQEAWKGIGGKTLKKGRGLLVDISIVPVPAKKVEKEKKP